MKPIGKVEKKLKALAARISQWGPAVVFMGTIFAASNTPAEKIPNFYEVDEVIKKGGHSLGYGLLSLAFLRGLGSTKRSAYSLALLFSFLFACSDEYHQSFTPGRTPSLIDIGIDTTGAVFALILHSRCQMIIEFTNAFLPFKK